MLTVGRWVRSSVSFVLALLVGLLVVAVVLFSAVSKRVTFWRVSSR
jgi:hypothetical protein